MKERIYRDRADIPLLLTATFFGGKACESFWEKNYEEVFINLGLAGSLVLVALTAIREKNRKSKQKKYRPK